MSLFDNPTALTQLEKAYGAILRKPTSTKYTGRSLTKSGKHVPRILTLGGDHTILLYTLRQVAAAYGPVAVVHFVSHAYNQTSTLVQCSLGFSYR